MSLSIRQLKQTAIQIFFFQKVSEVLILEGKIISEDVIFAQTELLKTVIEKGGEYLWKLRTHQGNIYKLAVSHFTKQEDKYLAQASSLEKGHGRIDEREILTSFRLAGKIEFPFVEKVFRIKRKSEEVKTGKVSEQVTYGITSLTVEEFGAKELLELARNHWRIENGLHYRRDITFKEDAVKKNRKMEALCCKNFYLFSSFFYL